MRKIRAAWRAPGLHVVLISWDGQHEAALAIARAVVPALRRRDRLSVIYSNRANRDEHGPGDWVKVPQDWYFGPKFACSLKLARDADVMLQIQVDALSDDWPGLVARLRAALRGRRRLGIWAPAVDWTPYPLRAAVLDRVPGGTLYHVAQTDGIVWALTRPVLDRLGRLDFGDNNLGWGIDYVAIALARGDRREVLCETGLTVRHPRTRGYADAGAEVGMTAFIDRLPPDERARVHKLQALVTRRRQGAVERTGRWEAMGGAIGMKGAAPLGGAVSDIFVRRGRVFVRGAPGLDLRAGTGVAGTGASGRGAAARPLIRLDAAPPLDEVPLAFPLAPDPGPATSVQLGDLGEWQMPGIPTLRIALHDPAMSRSLPLGPPVTVPGGTGDLQCGVALAAHRRGATLRLRLEGGAEPVRDIAMSVPEGVAGGARIEGYRCHAACVPGADAARTARLFLDYEGGALPPGETAPPMIFVAGPHLTRDAAQPDLIWPHHIHIRGRPDKKDMHWYATEAGRTAADLRLGPDVLPLLAEAPRLDVRAGAEGIAVACPAGLVAVSLWAGEVALATIRAGPTPRTLAWPGDIAPGPVSLRDGSGSRIWWSAPSS